MASAAVVGATVVGAATGGSVVIGAAEVGVTSGVLYGAVLVQQWLAQQCVCAATLGATTVGGTCALNGASNRAWLSVGALNRPVARHTVRCRRNKARRCETLTEEDTMWQLVRKRT